MKLKKVVSLALAGVLAVSMLAGCGSNKPEEPTQDDNGAVKTGYSAEFSKYVEDEITKLDYVSFKDNDADAAALKAVLGSYTDTQLVLNGTDGNTVKRITNNTAISDFEDQADLTVDFGFTGVFTSVKEMDKTQKLGTVYVVDGTVDIDNALQQIAANVNNALSKADLPEQGTLKATTGVVTYNYNYVVSVSVVNRATGTFDQVHASMNAIAVTVTRYSTPANA